MLFIVLINVIFQTFMFQCVRMKRNNDLTMQQKKTICMYKVDHPTVNYEQLTRYFNKKWSMTIKSGSMRYLILASDRWLSIPDDHDDQASDILPEDDTGCIVEVNVDTVPAEHCEDYSEVVAAADIPCELETVKEAQFNSQMLKEAHFNTDTVTAAEARKALITLVNYISQNHDIGKQHLKNIQKLLKAIDNYCADIDKKKDFKLTNMKHDVMDIDANDNFTGSLELKVEEQTETCPDDQDHFAGSESDDGTQTTCEVEVVCDKTYVLSDTGPQKDLTSKHTPAQHEATQVKSKDSSSNAKETKTSSDVKAFYVCKHCKKHCKSHNSLVDHMRKHIGKNEKLFLQCDKCDRKFTHRTQLWRHMKQHTLSRESQDVLRGSFQHDADLECPNKAQSKNKDQMIYDKAYTQDASHLQQTITSINELAQIETQVRYCYKGDFSGAKALKATAYQCDYCKKYCKSYNSMVEHMRKHPGKSANLLLECDKCGGKFYNRKQLWRHKKKPSCDMNGVQLPVQEKTLICDICKRAFLKTEHLSIHMKRNHTNQHKCGYCWKKFLSDMTLHTHMRRIHPKEYEIYSAMKPIPDKMHKDKYVCSVCGAELSRKASLKYHMLTHSEEEKPYACNICDMRFITQHVLKKHTYRHTGERPYKCDLCNKYFISSNTLLCHKRTHGGKKPHKCKICGNCYAYSNGLYTHMLWHAGKRPHLCSICGKRFLDRSSWGYHVNSHKGEKPYSCTICGDTFAKRQTHKLHMRHHDGVYSHICEQCGKGYESRISLERHILYNHKGVHPFVCGVCGKGYATRGSIKRHEATHQPPHPTMIR